MGSSASFDTPEMHAVKVLKLAAGGAEEWNAPGAAAAKASNSPLLLLLLEVNGLVLFCRPMCCSRPLTAPQQVAAPEAGML
jgi:hypothetical protein